MSVNRSTPPSQNGLSPDGLSKTDLSNDTLAGTFNALSSIEAACLLVALSTGKDIAPDELRARFDGAEDDMIIRIVDTLSPTRFDWMENPTDEETGLGGLLKRVPTHLHRTILEDALDLAFERLMLIGHIQISEKEGQCHPHQDANALPDSTALQLGQDFFPALFDGSEQAETTTRQAICTLSVWLEQTIENGHALSPTPMRAFHKAPSAYAPK